jgi:hypothetical protein
MLERDWCILSILEMPPVVHLGPQHLAQVRTKVFKRYKE